MSDLTKQQEVERGRRAKELLENPMLVESVEKLKARYLEEWTKTVPGDVEGRERLFQAYKMVDQICAHLRIVIGDGAVSSAQIAQLKRKS